MVLLIFTNRQTGNLTCTLSSSLDRKSDRLSSPWMVKIRMLDPHTSCHSCRRYTWCWWGWWQFIDHEHIHGATACSLHLSDHNHQVDYFCRLLCVCAGYVCVAIIHWTLTWTTGSLTCAQMLMHAIAHRGCMDTERESALKVDSREKVPCCTRELTLGQRHDCPLL